MTDDQPTPSHGNEVGPCAICGRSALPKFGHFLCRKHGTKKHAQKAEERLNE